MEWCGVGLGSVSWEGVVWVWVGVGVGVGVLGWSVSGGVVVLVVLGVHSMLLYPGLRSQDAEEPCGDAYGREPYT